MEIGNLQVLKGQILNKVEHSIIIL